MGTLDDNTAEFSKVCVLRRSHFRPLSRCKNLSAATARKNYRSTTPLSRFPFPPAPPFPPIWPIRTRTRTRTPFTNSLILFACTLQIKPGLWREKMDDKTWLDCSALTHDESGVRNLRWCAPPGGGIYGEFLSKRMQGSARSSGRMLYWV